MHTNMYVGLQCKKVRTKNYFVRDTKLYIVVCSHHVLTI